MWCEKCHYGSASCKLGSKCPACGHEKISNASPFNNKKKARKIEVEDKEDKKAAIKGDVSEIMGKAKHRQ